jgi:hypothetical protein
MLLEALHRGVLSLLDTNMYFCDGPFDRHDGEVFKTLPPEITEFTDAFTVC